MHNSLDSARYLLLSTRKRDGSSVATPVWFASDSQCHYVFSAADAGKVKRLKNFAEVSIARCTATGKALAEAQDTRATLFDEPATVEQCHQLLLAKYGWQLRILDFFSKLSGNYQKRAYIRIARP